MHRRLPHLLLAIAGLLWLSPAVRADLSEGLVGHWALDESAGDSAFDSSGQGNDGTLYGAGLAWMPGKGMVGGALSFDGNAHTECVEIPMSQMSVSAGTVALWARIGMDPQVPDTRYVFGHTTIPAYSDRIQLYMDGSNTELDVGLGDSHVQHLSVATLTPGFWYHLALTWQDGSYSVYVNGDQLADGVYTGLTALNSVAHIGNNGYTTPSQIFNGLIDDVRLYSRALMGEEVKRLAARPKAHAPQPSDEALVNETRTALIWTPSDYAVSHNLYLSTNLEDVVSRSACSFRGNLQSHYSMAGLSGYAYPGGLTAGTTYYWRVDEVNEAEPNSPWAGNIWTFSTPPALAYDPTPSDNAKFIDSNVELTWKPGLQAMLHYVHFGDSFESISDAEGGIPAADPEFTPGMLEANKTYYWRVDEFDGYDTRRGAVWTFTVTPVGGGLRADYFSGTSFETLRLRRVDPEIDFDWGSSAPDEWLPSDGFSVRWAGELEAAFTETYTFFATTDDGVRLWIDGWPVIDYWLDQSSTERKGTIDLVSGKHSILMEYYENTGSAVAQLRWASRSTPKQIIPQGALSLPVKAGSPEPHNGATDVSQQLVLRWLAGEAAVSHDVYLGTDTDAVSDATPTSPLYMGRTPIGSERIETGELAWDTTYYWRVDEVNELNGESPWQGNLWSFTTADFLTIDDMEDYNNYAPYRIFETWVDGWGDPSNGSLIGHPVRAPVRRNPMADWIVIEDTHEPLISSEMFAAAQSKRHIRHTDKSQSRGCLRSKYLFSGKIKCGHCGYSYHGATKKKKGWKKEGYVCGGFKLRGKHTCKENFLPSEVIEPAVFEALDAEVRTLEISGAVDRAGRDLGNAPALAQRKKDDLRRRLCEVETRLEELLDCITPENRDLISEKMVALRSERDKLKADLEDSAAIEARAVTSTKLAGRLVRLATEMRELWNVATLAEKKEFVACMVESISIHPRRRTASIWLSPKYLEMKRLAAPEGAASFLLDGRGDWIRTSDLLNPIQAL